MVPQDLRSILKHFNIDPTVTKEDLLRRAKEQELELRLEEVPQKLLFKLCKANSIKHKTNEAKSTMALNIRNYKKEMVPFLFMLIL